MRRFAALFGFALTLAAGSMPALAQDAPMSPEAAKTLDLVKRGIAFRTVAGTGNQTFEYATYVKGVLVDGGFDPGDVEVVRVDDTAYLVARYRGNGSAGNGAKPLLISGHMDVVEADPADWERDPFTAVVEDGYVFGRGASDMKTDLSAMVVALVGLKQRGWVPGRDVILLLSGDEETAMKTTALLAERFHDAELLINIDGGGGQYDTDGTPLFYGVQGAEKTYADFSIVATSPGGHSSAPREGNAIYVLSRGLMRLEAYQFPVQSNEITIESLRAAADNAPAPVATMLRRFADDPKDGEAATYLRRDPGFAGQLGTTCVATMVKAGHAPNALPQRAEATVNCRIFPGVAIEDVQATLRDVIADPALTVSLIDSGAIASPASPLRPDLMGVVTKSVQGRFPGLKIVPVMSAGATDSMHFRARGVPSYGVSPLFMRSEDSFAHGLNERVPMSEFGPAVAHYTLLLTELAK